MRKLSGTGGSVLGNVAAAGLAMMIVIGLAGCVPRHAHVTPTPRTSVAPVFKSDADALAAAKKAYEGYLAASDAIAQAGGADTSALEKWDTPKQLERDKAAFGRLIANKEHISGRSTYSNFELQQIDQSAEGRVRLSAYVCIDVSGTHLLNEVNQDVTPQGNDVVPLQLTFVSATLKSRKLLIDESQSWSGSDFCS